MPTSRIAVLIDADNSPAAKIDAVLSQVAAAGNAHVRRAYGDWKSPRMKGWEDRLQEFAIAPVQQFAYTKGKNASDIAMVIDAMDLLHAGVADGFAIVSSDADFTPLVMRLRQAGADVMGFGGPQAPAAFVNACSTFYRLDSLGRDEEDEDEDVEETADGPAAEREPRRSSPDRRKDGTELRNDGRLVRMLRTAVDEAADDHGWALLSTVSNQIRNQSSFLPRNYGYAKLVDLVEATELFEVDRSTESVQVRRKPSRGRRSSRGRT